MLTGEVFLRLRSADLLLQTAPNDSAELPGIMTMALSLSSPDYSKYSSLIYANAGQVLACAAREEQLLEPVGCR